MLKLMSPPGGSGERMPNLAVQRLTPELVGMDLSPSRDMPRTLGASLTSVDSLCNLRPTPSRLAIYTALD